MTYTLASRENIGQRSWEHYVNLLVLNPNRCPSCKAGICALRFAFGDLEICRPNLLVNIVA